MQLFRIIIIVNLNRLYRQFIGEYKRMKQIKN